MAKLKHARSNIMTLHKDIVAKIDGVLTGSIAIDDASDWAVHLLYEQEIPSSYLLEMTALRGLMMSKAGREGSFEDLRQLRAALTGEGTYTIEMSLHATEEIEKRFGIAPARDPEPDQ